MAIGDTSPGGFYPKNPTVDQELQGETGARSVEQCFIARLALTAAQAAAASTTAVHAAVTDNGSQQVITTGITNPPYTRNISVTFGGTAGDIKAISVTVAGTNEAGETISESIGPATLDTAGTVLGSKAFKTVTSITIPAHDGTGATTAVGFGDKIGLPHKLTLDTLMGAFLNAVEEATAPVLAKSSSALESNTVDLDSDLNGTAVNILYVAF